MNAADRVKETTTATSTATITLGGAVDTFRTFAAGFTVGMTDIPVSVDDGAGNWENGYYTLTSANQLTRTAIHDSSNGGAAVTFPAGPKDVECTLTAVSLMGALAAAAAAAAGSGSSGGSGTVIGAGVDPSDVGFDIVLCAGQSNMAGRGVLDTLADVADPRVWQFGGSTGNARYRTIFSGADPLHMAEGVNTGQVGPATAFARAYAGMIPSNRRVLLVPCAYGGTSMVAPGVNGFTPAAWSPTNAGSLYENAIAQANLALTAAQAMFPNSRFVGTIWHQGESDGDNNITQAVYAAALKALIVGFRSRITGAASSWFVIGGLCPEVIASFASYGPIDLAQKQVATETSLSAFATGPTGFRADTWHYSAPGARILGGRMAVALNTALAAAVVDTNPPAFLSAQVANSNKSQILVTMSEALAASAPDVSAFTASGGRTVTAVSISGSVATLTVSSAYAFGDSITVQYVKPGSGGMLQDAAGNLTLSFGPMAVTNNIAAPASSVVVSLGQSSGVSGNPVTVTARTNTPLTGSQAVSVSLSSTLAGVFGANPLALNASNSAGVSTTFTPSAIGSATITGTSTGTPALTSGSAVYASTAAATVPGAPTGVTATPGNSKATVNAAAPASNGGAAITGYTATATPAAGGTAITATSATLPFDLPGLTNGVAYNLTVHATNSAGSGPESSPAVSVTPAAPASATWSATDKDSGITLSNANLTVTGQSAPADDTWHAVRSNTSKSSGQWYFEVTVGVASSMMIGVGGADVALSSFPGSTATSWGYYNISGAYNSGAVGGGGTPATYANGDVIGVAFDVTAGTVDFYKNGVKQGTAHNNLGAPAFAMMATRNKGAPAATATANFGATSFAFAPPAGFSGLA